MLRFEGTVVREIFLVDAVISAWTLLSLTVKTRLIARQTRQQVVQLVSVIVNVV